MVNGREIALPIFLLDYFRFDIIGCRLEDLGKTALAKREIHTSSIYELVEGELRGVFQPIAAIVKTFVIGITVIVTVPLATAPLATVAVISVLVLFVRIYGRAMLYEVADESVTFLHVFNYGKLMVRVGLVIAARHVDARRCDTVATQRLDIGHETCADGIAVSLTIGSLDKLFRTDISKGYARHHVAVAATVDLSTETAVGKELDVGSV